MKPLMITAIFIAVLGMFQFGFNTGVLNSPQVHIEKFIGESLVAGNGGGLSPGTVRLLFSVAVSVWLVGGMIGGLSAGFVADSVGRRDGLLYVQTLSILGGILMGICKITNSYEVLVIGRFLAGLSCGFFTGLVPIYITEIAPVRIRGGLGTLNQLAITIGILSSQVLSLDEVFGSEGTWPVLLALGAAIPAVVQALALPFMPKSPRFLIINKCEDELGERCLEKMRGENVIEELEEIKRDRVSAYTQGSGEGHFSMLKLLSSKDLRLPLIICTATHMSQQLCGITAIFFYSTYFFTNAGIPHDKSKYATIGIGAIMVTMTLITVPLMDRLGRRTLHLVGLTGISLFSVVITISSVSLTYYANSHWLSYLIIFATFGFVTSFATGPGSIPWLITGEMFLQGPRPAATAIVTVANWTTNLAVALSFPTMDAALQDYSFIPFLVSVLLFIAFLYVYMPETKGLSTAEIARQYDGGAGWKGRFASRPTRTIITEGVVNQGAETEDGFT